MPRITMVITCNNCDKEYDPLEIEYQHGKQCECGGYVISPGGRIHGRYVEPVGVEA